LFRKHERKQYAQNSNFRPRRNRSKVLLILPRDTFGTQNIQNAESNEEEKYPFDKKIDTRDEIVRVSFKVKALKETDFIHMSPQLV
jgi:hypothetical protein